MASASQHISKIEIKPEENLKAPKKDVGMLVDSTCFNIFHEVKHLDYNNLDWSLDVEPKLCITRANQNEELETVNEVINVPVINSPFGVNVLHKLAAKKIISQLVVELKEADYGQHEGIKKKIIDISVKEQVLSPHTALVGVADEATVTGVSQRVEVESMSDPYGGRFRPQMMMKCAAAPRRHNYNTYAMANLSLQSTARSSYSHRESANLKSKSLFGSITKSISNAFSAPKIKTCGAPPPNMANRPRNTSDYNTPINKNIEAFTDVEMYGRSINRAAQPYAIEKHLAQRNTRRMFSAASSDDESSDSWDGSSSCAPGSSSRAPKSQIISKPSKSSPSKPISNNYQTITNAQDPSGYWTSITSINLEPASGKLISAKISDEKISATIYALVLLLSKFASQYNEWKLTAIKGVSFLKSKLGENAVGKFNELVAEVGATVDDDFVDELFE